MKNPFKRETSPISSLQVTTPYQKAQHEWDERIGLARVQAKNWRLVAIFSLSIAALLLFALIISLTEHKDKLFVAEVRTNGQVVNIAPLTTNYQPTQAQTEYFLSQFIKLIRGLPLDPVVAKQNWLSAYNLLTQRAATQLNSYLRQNNPLNLLGKETVTIKINDINQISNKTYHIDWQETVVNADGEPQGQHLFSGVFTITIKQPTSQNTIFANPLGIHIVDFQISARGK